MAHEELLKKIKAQEEYWTNLVHYTKPEFYENTVDQRNAWQALKALLELHNPLSDKMQFCVECKSQYNGESDVVAYPCSTIKAIEKALS